LDEPELQNVFERIQSQSGPQQYDSALQERISKCSQCVFERPSEDENRYWGHTHGFRTVALEACSNAIYLPGTTSSGVIVISDAMGSELVGTRQTMVSIGSRGFHVIKPMLFEPPDTHIDFFDMMVAYYTKESFPKSLPTCITRAVEYLKAIGVRSISLLGVCWGGCVVQHLLSLDDSFTCGVSIDGLVYKPDYSALSPSLFIMSNDKMRKEQHLRMKGVMWNNNIYPWDLHMLDTPLEHGHIMKGFECVRSRLLTNPCNNKLGVPDADFRAICNTCIESHVYHVQMVIDFFAQFNSFSQF